MTGHAPRLRIAGGRWRGRAITAAPGTRPTEQRVREALFSIWQPRLAGCRLLDLYAGGGTVALEGLSRGVAEAVCVESDRRALATLEANRDALEATGIVAVPLRLPAGLASLAKREPKPFDLIFADPPYAFLDHEALLLGLAPLLAAAGEVTIEHAGRAVTPDATGPLVRFDLRTYGGTALSRYRRE